MRKLSGKTYWIIGASEGLGRALAKKLSKAGCALVLSARSADSLQALADSLPGEARIVPCDVSDRESVVRAAQDAGEVDGMVFLAGVYWPFPATEWQPEQTEAMFDVNLTGAARVLGQVVPAMVARGAGHIVITGSLSGYRGLPGSIGYSSSKAGLMHLAESMYADLRGTGVDVQLANPGFIRTRLTDKNNFNMPFLMEPDQAAEEMMQLMRSEKFQRAFPRLFSLVFRGANFLPDGLYFRVFGGR
ncbi:SDR family NAD(P)-dependent oxidoreductase [Roseinatronobacter bogoriensis]|uniref:Short-chain dehydrogenase n=1 Tax=Roseinatronobacter bogoriensis subsp. barguzinensis TaxID=441209 RepID=A0A2K8KFZ8_9RHOB|nr:MULTISPECIES: SDR family NAD(P)-dependent oxidoreductase [Rhodobaca]ATX65090.1 short-chain dehydrogenase [Rhodobaca barguzinensis]MBB4209573.1 short-subunit dehydrogenase [Rhodobaca bogoriensis DSM 18756]TDW35435.1 short-subunit dehydrogenase [Rhodobaca barguzinensis]TDY66646.1 short-subunit dehydrogenase [Rhodobaca bogoriensis DSM 18756]